ncbi:MAG: GDYXXLXY domain-containing protein [Bosea sp. (in: a-proteobacteria)]
MRVDDMVARVPLVVRAGLAALVLCGLILAMVIERASILRNGATVRLATTPVDPRDLFRGDYVILGYEIGTVNLTRVGAATDLKTGETVFVGLKPAADGRAEAVKLVREGQARETGLTWVKATSSRWYTCGMPTGGNCAQGDILTRLTYGLESYFVPEGQGRAIETTPASRVEIIAAISASGKAAIKSLLIDGKPVYDEPPY